MIITRDAGDFFNGELIFLINYLYSRCDIQILPKIDVSYTAEPAGLENQKTKKKLTAALKKAVKKKPVNS